jgi:hypothetical protein
MMAQMVSHHMTPLFRPLFYALLLTTHVGGMPVVMSPALPPLPPPPPPPSNTSSSLQAFSAIAVDGPGLQAFSAIAVDAAAPPQERFAAEQLAHWLSQILPAPIPVISTPNSTAKGLPYIAVGAGATYVRSHFAMRW